MLQERSNRQRLEAIEKRVNEGKEKKRMISEALNENQTSKVEGFRTPLTGYVVVQSDVFVFTVR